MKNRIGMAMAFSVTGLMAQPAPPAAPVPPVSIYAPGHPVSVSGQLAIAAPGVSFWQKGSMSYGRAQETYRSGIRYLDERQYEKAVNAFETVARERGTRADGALYWKAYALRRLGRSSEALGVLGELEKEYANSRWRNDAKALEVEIKQASGASVGPDSQEDEEMKLLALNGLVQNDPEAALPLLEKILSSPKNPPRMKQRALFVLAQSRNPKAREMVMQYARGGSNPDLQLNAIDYLGAINTAETRQMLGEIYRSSSDATIKRTALQGMARSRDKAQLFEIAKAESDMDLKREAVRYLGNAGGGEELKELFRSETDRNVRLQIVGPLSDHIKPAGLVELARAEKDAAVKKEIVRRLSDSRSKEAQAYLLELLQE